MQLSNLLRVGIVALGAMGLAAFSGCGADATSETREGATAAASLAEGSLSLPSDSLTVCGERALTTDDFAVSTSPVGDPNAAQAYAWGDFQVHAWGGAG